MVHYNEANIASKIIEIQNSINSGDFDPKLLSELASAEDRLFHAKRMNRQKHEEEERAREESAKWNINLFESIEEIFNHHVHIEGNKRNKKAIEFTANQIGIDEQTSQKISNNTIQNREETILDITKNLELKAFGEEYNLTPEESKNIFERAIKEALKDNYTEVGEIAGIYNKINSDLKSATTREELHKIAETLGVETDHLRNLNNKEITDLLSQELENSLNLTTNHNLRIDYEAFKIREVIYQRLDNSITEQTFESSKDRSEFIKNFIGNQLNELSFEKDTTENMSNLYDDRIKENIFSKLDEQLIDKHFSSTEERNKAILKTISEELQHSELKDFTNEKQLSQDYNFRLYTLDFREDIQTIIAESDRLKSQEKIMTDILKDETLNLQEATQKNSDDNSRNNIATNVKNNNTQLYL